MGKMILQVDVHEILSLVWDHPFVTGLLVLMCTPKLFPVVMYFSPLLISTALVTVLIISTGRAPIKAKEGEMPWYNNSKLEEDNSTPKADEVKPQSRFLGEERFLEWFHSLQSASLRSSPRSSPPLTPPRMPMAAIKGQSLFRPDESTIDFGKKDTTGRELKGRLDFERSFSFRTGDRAAAAAGIGLAESPPTLSTGLSSPIEPPSPPPGPPPMQMVSLPSKGNQFDDAAAQEMPSMFRYDERSGARGLATGIPEKHRTEKYHGAEKSFGGGDRTFTNVPSSKAKAAPPLPPDNLSARIDRNSEMVPFGSFSMSDVIEAVERAQQDDPDPEPQCSIFEMGRGAAPTAPSKVSPLKSLTSKNLLRSRSIAADRGGSQGEIGARSVRNAGFGTDEKPDRRGSQGEFGFRAVRNAGLGTDEKRQSFLAPQSPGFFDLDSGNATPLRAPLSKTLPEYGRSKAYNATLRAGNAAGYNNPSSKIDSSTKDTVDRPELPPTNRKGGSNRENRQSSPLRFWKATSWQTPQTPNRQTSQAPSWQTPQTPSRQTPQTPNRQLPQTQSWQTPQTPSRQTQQTPSRQTLHTLSRQTSQAANRQTSQGSAWQTPQTPNRQTLPPTNWNWHAPPSAIWQNSQSKAWDAAPPSNWQSPAPAQPYTAWQDHEQESPLPSWQESPATHTANTLKTSRSGGVRKLDEYSRYQSALHSNKR